MRSITERFQTIQQEIKDKSTQTAALLVDNANYEEEIRGREEAHQMEMNACESATNNAQREHDALEKAHKVELILLAEMQENKRTEGESYRERIRKLEEEAAALQCAVDEMAEGTPIAQAKVKELQAALSDTTATIKRMRQELIDNVDKHAKIIAELTELRDKRVKEEPQAAEKAKQAMVCGGRGRL